jgi:hypothetical protein
LVLALCGSLGAQGFPVCLEDRAGLNQRALAAFEKELSALLPDVEISPCGQAGDTVVLTVRTEPPRRYATALGLARRQSGEIRPQLEIYVGPLVRLLGNVRAPAVVGRALARVAGHELWHYLSQRSDHDHTGLFSASLRPWDVAAETASSRLALPD